MLLKRNAAAARADRERPSSGSGSDLGNASSGKRVVDPDVLEQRTEAIIAATDTLFPEDWLKRDASADFDLIAGSLDRMQSAVEAGQYHIAEQARIEAYAFFELGPEQRLRGLAPELFVRSEGLFWYGSGSNDGLATLINGRASPAEIAANRVALNRALSEAEEAVGTGPKSRTTVITNTAIIVFREGLEAVLILAALMASFKGAQRRLRRPMWVGVGRGARRQRRHLGRRPDDHDRPRALRREAVGGGRADRDRHAARDPQLVLPQDLLDRPPGRPARQEAGDADDAAASRSRSCSRSARSASRASTARASRRCCSCRRWCSRPTSRPC